MISATNVNEEIQNKLSEEERDNVVEKVLSICSGQFTSMKEAKQVLKMAFEPNDITHQAFLDINQPLNIKNSRDKSWPALLVASWFKQTDIVKELLVLGAKPQEHLFQIIHIAVTQGDQKMCRLIFNCVPDINNARSTTGMTALMVAAETGKTEVAKMLIHDFNADFDLKDNDGKDCFIHAKDKNRFEMTAFLNNEKLQRSLSHKTHQTKRPVKI